MKMRIKEFAEFTGVSVRTLHYYDEIGLLVPAFVDRDTGYRFYDEKSLLRMQEILFYRELDFSLKSIGKILSASNYDKNTALKQQKHLLILKKERLERLISAIDDAVKGENVMKVFDNSEFEKYKAEAREKWGETEAYQEYEKKTQNGAPDARQRVNEGLNAVFADFAACMKSGEEADSAAALEVVQRLRDYITANYYTCSKQILAGLGQMYVADDRFRANIDQNGAGTAEFASAAILTYCSNE